jgi:hypothetical protein
MNVYTRLKGIETFQLNINIYMLAGRTNSAVTTRYTPLGHPKNVPSFEDDTHRLNDIHKENIQSLLKFTSPLGKWYTYIFIFIYVYTYI